MKKGGVEIHSAGGCDRSGATSPRVPAGATLAVRPTIEKVEEDVIHETLHGIAAMARQALQAP